MRESRSVIVHVEATAARRTEENEAGGAGVPAAAASQAGSPAPRRSRWTRGARRVTQTQWRDAQVPDV